MQGIERRIVYLIMLIAVTIPLVTKLTLTPSRKVKAEEMFQYVEALKPEDGKAAFVWMDFGPNTKAENGLQAEVILEHLMRKRIPVIVASFYQLSEGFLTGLPQKVATRLETEFPGQHWEYGQDWINIGYKPAPQIFLQQIVKSSNLTETLAKDVNGLPLSQYPKFANIKGLESISLVAQITGLVGMFDAYIGFLQKDGYRVPLVHGCTSITIPEAYIYLDSGQLLGLLEGFAGAAWYSDILRRTFTNRAADPAIVANSTIGVAHLVIIALIIVGNIVEFAKYSRRRSHG